MRFIETPIFTRDIDTYIPQESYRALQRALLLRPDAGVLIPAVPASENCVGRNREKEKEAD